MLTIPVDAHKEKCGIDDLIDDSEIQMIPIGNAAPVVDSCPSKGIDSKGDV